MKSEKIGELSLALSITQSQIQGAKKDSLNPFFKSSYSDLASVWDACRVHLAKNALSIIQTVHKINSDLFLRTTLSHSSGEWIASDIPLTLGKQDMQALGSAITYARRYGISAIVGICPEDDDGEAAMARSNNNNNQAKPVTQKPNTLSPVMEEIMKMFKVITNNFSDKLALDGLVLKFGKSADISSMSIDRQEVILNRLKFIHQENQGLV